MLQRAAHHFGWRSPALLWLATQTVLCALPGAWIHGVALKKARATLRLLESESRNHPNDGDRPSSHRALARIRGFESENEINSLPISSAEEAVNAAPAHQQPPIVLQTGIALPSHSPLNQPQSSNATTVRNSNLLESAPAFLGEITHAAGLLFLLNALRHLGIASVFQSHPALAEASLPAHILKRLAQHAGVVNDDPILLCLPSAGDSFTLPPEILSGTLSLPTAWPPGFAPSAPAARTSQYLLRAWSLAVELWCWRHARLTLREIVRRKGRLTRTRTDIDITFPLDRADVRIRRAGLDIDPGWLPWFGDYGQVVRFHYRDREPENNAC
jgi:hypothetical protein